MVLLHLLRKAGCRFPVVCFREPWMPWKQRFANRIIEEWNLTVWDWHPQYVQLCKGMGRIDILNFYSFGQEPIMLARGTERPDGGNIGCDYLCGRDTFLSRPLGTFTPPWDLAFHGHKSCDEDACSGKVPLQLDIKDTPGSVASVFPLRNWSDEDIFEYIDEHNVPYDTTRYEKTSDGWKVITKDKKYNPDYYHTCLKCLDPQEGAYVQCPKLNNLQINNISNRVVWSEPSMDYCGLRSQS